MIQSKIDIELTRQRDHHWEDGINVSSEILSTLRA
jgi:hypothetical protein